MHASLQTEMPVIYGIVTIASLEQGLERAQEGEANRGYEAGRSALEMIALFNQAGV